MIQLLSNMEQRAGEPDVTQALATMHTPHRANSTWCQFSTGTWCVM
jgi:hypothetical protein